MNERGVTLLELLIAMAVGSVVLLGVGSFYVATLRSSRQDSAQTFLQRQGALIIEEMARQIRPATALARGVCNADANSLQATNKDLNGNPQTFCFYKSGNQLNENRSGGGTANLLAGSPVSLTVSSFSSDCIRDPSNTCITDPNGIVGATFTSQLQDQTQNSMAFRTALRRQN